MRVREASKHAAIIVRWKIRNEGERMELKVENLSKKFGSYEAVNHINFSLEKGVYGLLGANGAGKTTLMRMLCTLMTPSTGTITYNGQEIRALDEKYRQVLGYLPQEFGYYPEFSAKDYLNYIAALKGLRPMMAKRKVKELLELVSLTKYSNKKIKTFSGGMKRRLGIAQAVLNEPEILILDEPTAGLDPKERIRFRKLISHLAQDRIVLLSTHIVSDLESIAKEILIMKEGSLIAKDSTENLLETMRGEVWNCLVGEQEAEKLQEHYLVTNMKTEENRLLLRVLGKEQPCPQAVLTDPTLEDLFMNYFGEVLEDEDYEIRV